MVGDIHGQLDDVFAIFKQNGIPSERNAYLFNGDFVDRGKHSCECVLVLLAFKLLYPNTFHLNRGNHEARGVCTHINRFYSSRFAPNTPPSADINSRDGFERECVQKYNTATFDLFCR